jgi:hypothetical protein
MRALLYTSDPYEPSGVVGLYETEEQRQNILEQYAATVRKRRQEHLKGPWRGNDDYRKTLLPKLEQHVQEEVDQLKDIEIPVGVYGEFY